MIKSQRFDQYHTSQAHAALHDMQLLPRSDQDLFPASCCSTYVPPSPPPWSLLLKCKGSSHTTTWAPVEKRGSRSGAAAATHIHMRTTYIHIQFSFACKDRTLMRQADHLTIDHLPLLLDALAARTPALPAPAGKKA